MRPLRWWRAVHDGCWQLTGLHTPACMLKCGLCPLFPDCDSSNGVVTIPLPPLALQGTPAITHLKSSNPHSSRPSAGSPHPTPSLLVQLQRSSCTTSPLGSSAPGVQQLTWRDIRVTGSAQQQQQLSQQTRYAHLQALRRDDSLMSKAGWHIWTWLVPASKPHVHKTVGVVVVICHLILSWPLVAATSIMRCSMCWVMPTGTSPDPTGSKHLGTGTRHGQHLQSRWQSSRHSTHSAVRQLRYRWMGGSPLTQWPVRQQCSCPW